MNQLLWSQQALIRAFFKRTHRGILEDHLLPELHKLNDYETLEQDAQRYLSDLYFAREQSKDPIL